MKKIEIMDIGEIETTESLCAYLTAFLGSEVRAMEFTNLEEIPTIVLRVKMRGWKLVRYVLSNRFKYNLGTTILTICRSVREMPSDLKIQLIFEV